MSKREDDAQGRAAVRINGGRDLTLEEENERGRKKMNERNKESLRAARWPGGQTFCHEKVHIPFKLWTWFNFPCVLKLFFTRGSIKYSLTLTKLPQWKTKGNVKYVKTFSKTPSKLLSFVHQNAQY